MRTDPLNSGSYAEFPSELSALVTANTPVVILQCQKDIERLLQRSRNLFVPLYTHKIRVSIDGLSSRNLSDAQMRLNANLRECGCQESSIAAALTLFVYVALLIFEVGWPSSWHWRHLVLGMGSCFAMAILGKAIGLLRARFRLIQELESLWKLNRNRKLHNTGE